MAKTRFTGPIESAAGFTYNDVGVTVVVPFSATLVSSQATFASGLTTMVDGWAQLVGLGNADATSAVGLIVEKSGTDLLITAVNATGAAAVSSATINVFAVGVV